MLLWPALLFIFLALFRLYDAVFPCNAGFFIGGCDLGKFLIGVLVFESLIVYACFSLIFILLLGKRLNPKTKKFLFVLLGILSIAVVFAGVTFVIPGLFSVFVDPVFYVMNLFSGSAPLAVVSTWRTQLHLFFPFEPKTVWQRVIGLLLFPFLP